MLNDTTRSVFHGKLRSELLAECSTVRYFTSSVIVCICILHEFEDSERGWIKRLRMRPRRVRKIFMRSYSEKGRGAASFESPVFDFRLLREILGALDR